MLRRAFSVFLLTMAATACGKSSAATPHASTASSPSLHFVGSRNSNVYHLPGCREADRIKAENLRTFNTRADAGAAGYRPCKVCDP